MHMPLMVELKRVTVFGGERGEGLQKTQKLAVFADELLVVAEAPGVGATLELAAGQQPAVNEKLSLVHPRSVPVHPRIAADLDDNALRALIEGRSFVVSDLANRKLNERIFAVAQSEGVLCTVVDTKDLCTAWFMSLIKTDHLQVAVSSNGSISYAVPRLRAELTPLVEAREPEAAALARVRAVLPRKGRKDTLDRIATDSHFRQLADTGAACETLWAHAQHLAGLKETP